MHLLRVLAFFKISTKKHLVETLLLKNINLILAFIINIISQPIEHLNISSAFIVYTNTEMHVVLYKTIAVYTAIMISLSGSVGRTCEYNSYF